MDHDAGKITNSLKITIRGIYIQKITIANKFSLNSSRRWANNYSLQISFREIYIQKITIANKFSLNGSRRWTNDYILFK